MAIVVSGVASSTKTPDIYLEVFPGTSGRGGTAAKKSVIVGGITGSGSMSDDDVEQCENVDDAKALAGQGSELHLAAKGFYAVHPGGDLYLAAATGTTASTRTVTFTGNDPATAAGTYKIWCNGNQYSLTISVGDSLANQAAALNTGLQAADFYGDLPFTTGVAGAVVTFTTKSLGPHSQWDVSMIHQDLSSMPSGNSATLSAVSASGGSDPTLTNIVAALTPADYDYIGWHSIDATAITAIEAYLTTQNGPITGFYQQSVLGSVDTYTNTLAIAQTNANYKEIQVAWSQTDNETRSETIGRTIGLRALKEGGDPAFPYNWETLPGYRIHSNTANYPTKVNIENCLNNGITPIGVRSGNGAVVRSITSYSLNGSTPDYSALDTSTVTVPQYMAYDLKATMQVLFQGKKLADDYTDPTATPRGVVTPKMVKDVIYRRLKIAEAAAIVSDVEPYTAQIDAKVDAVVAGRLNFECPVPTIDGLYVVAGNVRGF